MTKVEITTPSEYGVMFLYDSIAKPQIPNDAGEKLVTHTCNCVAFRVLIYVDGDAKVVLCDKTDSDYREYFSGDICCPSKTLSLWDTNGFAFATLPIQDELARISLRMSDDDNPDVVECVIKNIRSF
jgi:hypothetical protein